MTSRFEAELAETIGLIRAVRRFVGNYEKFGPETGARGMNHLAARRVEEALIECLRVAIDELHGGGTGERMLVTQAEIATLENHQCIDDPASIKSFQAMAEKFMGNGAR